MKTKINTVKINKTDKPVTRLLKGKKREKIKMTNIRSKRGDIITDSTDLKREYQKNLYAHIQKHR